MLERLQEEVEIALHQFLNGMSDNLNICRLLTDMAEHGNRPYVIGETMPLNRSLKRLALINGIPLGLCISHESFSWMLRCFFHRQTALNISFYTFLLPLLLIQIVRIPFNVDFIKNLNTEILDIHQRPRPNITFNKSMVHTLYCAFGYLARSIQCTLTASIPLVGPAISFLMTCILTADTAFEYGQNPFAANRRCINEKAYFFGFGLMLTAASMYLASMTSIPFFANDAIFMFLLPGLIAAAQCTNEGIGLEMLKRPQMPKRKGLFHNANIFFPADYALGKTLKYLTPSKLRPSC